MKDDTEHGRWEMKHFVAALVVLALVACGGSDSAEQAGMADEGAMAGESGMMGDSTAMMMEGMQADSSGMMMMEDSSMMQDSSRM